MYIKVIHVCLSRSIYLQYTTCTTGAPTGQNRSMQLAASPWQFATPGIWATGIQPQALLTAAPNQIFFRDPSQPDMLFQSPQPIQTHNGRAINTLIYLSKYIKSSIICFTLKIKIFESSINQP